MYQIKLDLPEVVLVAQSNRRKQDRFAVNDLNVGRRSVLIILHQTDRQLYHKVDYDGQANKNPKQSETETIVIFQVLELNACFKHSACMVQKMRYMVILSRIEGRSKGK